MFRARKLLAWLIIGNTSPFALPLSGSDVDELSVEIGQAAWTPPDAGAKVRHVKPGGNPAIRLTRCIHWI
jgi:hypothetical protein